MNRAQESCGQQHTKICIMNVPEGEKGEERIFEEIMVKNFQNLMKDLNLDVQEAQQTPSRINRRDSTPRHYNQTVETH